MADNVKFQTESPATPRTDTVGGSSGRDYEAVAARRIKEDEEDMRDILEIIMQSEILN